MAGTWRTLTHAHTLSTRGANGAARPSLDGGSAAATSLHADMAVIWLMGEGLGRVAALVDPLGRIRVSGPGYVRSAAVVRRGWWMGDPTSLYRT